MLAKLGLNRSLELKYTRTWVQIPNFRIIIIIKLSKVEYRLRNFLEIYILSISEYHFRIPSRTPNDINLKPSNATSAPVI
ncbi:hypothetical protein BpHYR1_019111 [Brachionus plicatilis]|uniref:Uncharacterized protein n=1 Tax=Brachionus plicatilis TaxID=10195 RepID=A0A3M7SD04_BRAPC|nr:hypothetical protein BpHYR1_019111 [Brachionus plicatilis]